MAQTRKVSIIGAGTVGTAVAYLLGKHGYEIVALAARTEETLAMAHSHVQAFSTCDIVDAAKKGDVILITTSDDQIESACREIAAGGGVSPGDAVFHMSGALPLSVLAAAREAGAMVGSIHPMQTFADVEGAIKNIPGSVFGVTADEDLRAVAEELVKGMGGEPVDVNDSDKVIYHAAAVAVCNYFVTLVHYGEDLYRALGIPADTALKAFLPLLKGTVANIERSGTAGALTGPIARGDIGTVKRHLEALEERLPDKVDVYKLLGRHTVHVALEKGSISAERANEILDLLG